MSNGYVDKVSAVGTVYDIHVPDGAITRAKLDADLQGKTDAVPELKSTLKTVDIKNSLRVTNGLLWASGVFSSTTGRVSQNSQFIRTAFRITLDNIDKFYLDSGYTALVYAWDATSDDYVGVYKGDGTFSPGSGAVGVNSFEFSLYPGYSFGVCIRTEPISDNISIADGDKCKFYIEEYKSIQTNVEEIMYILNDFNIFDQSTKTDDKLIKVSNGVVTNITSGFITDYIDVSLFSKVVFTASLGSDTYGHAFYDSGKNFISGSGVASYGDGSAGTGMQTVSVPQNARYMVASGRLVDINKYMIIALQKVSVSFPQNEIEWKHVVTYGDSLTWYDGNAFTWGDEEGTICVGFQSYLRNELKLSVTNRGVSGKTTPQICSNIINANDLTTFDYMTIMGGDNDDRLGVSVGTLQPVGGTFDTSTVYGALQNAIEYALTQNPALRIILMTEPMGWTYENGRLDRVSDLIPNAYRKVAEQYGIPMIDNWNKSGVNEKTRNYYYLDPDDTENVQYMYHPNNIGWKQISKVICDEIKKY